MPLITDHVLHANLYLSIPWVFWVVNGQLMSALYFWSYRHMFHYSNRVVSMTATSTFCPTVLTAVVGSKY